MEVLKTWSTVQIFGGISTRGDIYRGDLPIRNWPKAMCLLCFLKMKKLTGPNRLWFLKSVEIGCPSTNQGPPRPAGSRAAGANRGIS